jgi:hypothetical protein
MIAKKSAGPKLGKALRKLDRAALFQVGVDGEQDEVAQVPVGLAERLEDEAVVVEGEGALNVAVQLPEAFYAQILEVDELALLKPLHGVDIEPLDLDRAQELAHDLAIGLIVCRAVFPHGDPVPFQRLA